MQSTPATVPNIIISGFHALSETLRVKVLQLLKNREICVCDLCDILDVSQSKLSFHLKTLKEANLVCARQRRALDLLQPESTSVSSTTATFNTIY